MNQHSFFLQLASKGAGGLVVTSYDQASLDEITGNGTHTDATSSYKINSFYIFQFHDGFNGSNGVNGLVQPV